MGERGPAKKPSTLRLLEGDRSHRKPNTREPKPQIRADVPPPPEVLKDEARDEWLAVAPELHRLGLLTAADTEPLLSWCLAVHRERVALAEWETSGYEVVVTSAGGQVYANPVLGVLKEAASTKLAISRRFGFTPSDRAGLKGPEVDSSDTQALLTPLNRARAIRPAP